ncbi:hypothetical protein DM02DRAFT_114558 [Periconia macrospinosa]|uniref:Uncharacterized protein n=1 Tax=Periconia macrospinosa TaxID=97972 RepID=A0A2V1DEW1_9PLEO|nr:hypothetical protein DM02DRAFT_114558 [Periconia macrospinosa]
MRQPRPELSVPNIESSRRRVGLGPPGGISRKGLARKQSAARSEWAERVQAGNCRAGRYLGLKLWTAQLVVESVSPSGLKLGLARLGVEIDERVSSPISHVSSDLLVWSARHLDELLRARRERLRTPEPTARHRPR